MPELIDVTGLPEPVIRDIRKLIETLQQTQGGSAPASTETRLSSPPSLPTHDGVVLGPWKRRELYEDVG